MPSGLKKLHHGESANPMMLRLRFLKKKEVTMKRIYCILFLAAASGFFSDSEGQITYEKHVVAKPFTRSAGLGLADVDSDGDKDILAGSGVTGFFWFENLGGDPLQWNPRPVDVSIKGCLSVRQADIDQDGVPDLVASSWDDNSVFWYRNTGNQVWEKKTIDSNCGQVHEVFVLDINGDGLLDVLAAAVMNNEIMWYRNPGPGSQTWIKQVITNTFGGSRTVSAGDLDRDGKPEIVGGAFDGDRITIWKNGGGNPIAWQATNLTTNFNGAHRIQIIDLNQDGRLDIIGWAYVGGLLQWWENNGNDFANWTKRDIDIQLGTSCVGEAKDMDLDGDLDVVSTGFTSNQVIWYENSDGKATAWKKKAVDTGLVEPWMAFADDIDGDIDIDIVAGGDEGAEIRWYENHPGGRFDTYIPAAGANLKTSIYLCESYEDRSPSKLLISLHGSSEEKYASTLRDYLIPAADEVQIVIASPNLGLAAAPDYNWSNPAEISEVIAHLIKRFHISSDAVYLMGTGCQGKPALQMALSGAVKVKGAIAFNPLINTFRAADWSGSAASLAIAADKSRAGYETVEKFSEKLWMDGKRTKLIPYEGNGTEFLIDELSSFTIQCLNYIDSSHLLTNISSIDRDRTSLSARISGGSGQASLLLSGRPGEPVNITIFDLTGRCIGDPCRFTLSGGTDLAPFGQLSGLSEGIYVIRVRGLEGRSTSVKIYRADNRL